MVSILFANALGRAIVHESELFAKNCGQRMIRFGRNDINYLPKCDVISKICIYYIYIYGVYDQQLCFLVK